MFIADPATASSVAASTAEKAGKILPKVDTILANMFEHAASAVQDGAIWLQGQIPDVIKQFLKWKATEDIVYIVLGLMVGLGAYIISRICWKMHKTAVENSHYYDGSWMIGVILPAIIGTILTLLIVCHNLLDLLEILIAPKVYLLEYAANVYQSHH